METVDTPALTINAPEFFKDPEFVGWLNSDVPKFTWHIGGAPGDYSDVIVCVDPALNGEGSDSDMPEHVWNLIVDECRKHYRAGARTNHIMVRLTNLDDGTGAPEVHVLQKVAVVCRNSSGEPAIFTCKVTVTEEQRNNGEHYDQAEFLAAEAGYEGPMVAFDQADEARKQLNDVLDWFSNN